MTQKIAKTKSTGLTINNVLENALSITKPTEMVNHIEKHQDIPKYLEIYHDVTKQLKSLLEASLHDKQKEIASLYVKLQDNLTYYRDLNQLYENSKLETEQKLDLETEQKIISINAEEDKDPCPNEQEYSKRRLSAINYFEYANKYNIVIPETTNPMFRYLREYVIQKEAKVIMGENNVNKMNTLSEIIEDNKSTIAKLSKLIDKLEKKDFYSTKTFDGNLYPSDFNTGKLVEIKNYIKESHIHITCYFMPINQAYEENKQDDILKTVITLLTAKTAYAKQDDASIIKVVENWKEEISCYSYYAIQSGLRNYYDKHTDFPKAIATVKNFIKP